jgi:hypothetical protein
MTKLFLLRCMSPFMMLDGFSTGQRHLPCYRN